MSLVTKRNVWNGAVSGLVGGVVSGILLQLARTTTPDGIRAPAMTLVAGAAHTTRAPLAWLAYLVYAVLIGAAFGWLLGRQDVTGGSSVIWGVLYGGFWWIASGLVVIPVLYGAGPFTPAGVDVIRNASLPWFAAMLLHGGVLGATYALMTYRRPPRPRADVVTTPRAA